MSLEIKKITQSIINCLETEQRIQAAYLYGSVADGTNTPLSDIDIGILMNELAVDSIKKLDYELYIEAKLSGAIPGNKFDVRIINDAPILIKGKIITEGKLLLETNREKVRDFEEHVIIRYLDFKVDYNYLVDITFKDLINGK